MSEGLHEGMEIAKAPIPYHLLERSNNTVLGVRGSSIDLISIDDGSLKSTWKCSLVQPRTKKSSATAREKAAPVPSSDHISDPPGKKWKLSETERESQKVQIQSKKQINSNKRAQIINENRAPLFIAFQATRDGKHMVGVTGEDKCIRVFTWRADDLGQMLLEQISERVMPKRPCAIAITGDDSTILSADKFGDVWSLPLLPAERDEAANDSRDVETGSILPKKPFVPAASELTVHSRRNLKALEHQKRQASHAIERQTPTFEKKLLLGHVSMLTDIASTRFDDRDYIITSDRDEHIRVSRGILQPHIINRYLLRHTMFVTRLCIPKERPNILISGGGDKLLISWDLTSSLEDPDPLSCVNVSIAADIATIPIERVEQSASDTTVPDVAISGIHHIRTAPMSGLPQDLIVVICEGVVALMVFELSTDGKLIYLQHVPLPANPLAIVDITSQMDGEDFGLLVSLDYFHCPGTTNRPRDRTHANYLDHCLVKVISKEGKLISTDYGLKLGVIEFEDTAMQDLSCFLYPRKNLRKKEGKDND